ncbi:MAG TPA: hypothetical protein VN782_13725 [Usitatibacter sp.]|nr:hypothetical protein [Usitatibacter sp.]
MLRVRFVFAAALLLLGSAFAHASSLPGFDDLERSLRLDAVQKAQFDVAVGATQRALVSVGLGALELKARIAAELAKPAPDVDEIARAQEQIVEQSRPLFREAHREWERFFAMLDREQERRARALIGKKLAQLERLGDQLRGLLGEAFR